MIRPWVEFKTTVPDDGIEADGVQEETYPGWVRYPGKPMAEIIGGFLTKLGCEVDPPAFAGDHGWDFDVRREGHRFWCQVSPIDDFLVVIDDPTWFGKFSKRKRQLYVEILSGLARELSADERFSNILWFSREEMDRGSGGGHRPVE